MIEVDNWLINYFEEAQSRNPSFSIRSFAKQLKLSPSLLSQLLSGKKEMTYERANRLVKALKLNSKQSKQILSYYYNLKKRSEKTKKELFSVINDNELATLSECEVDIEKFPHVFDWKSRLVFHNIPLEWSPKTDIENYLIARYDFKIYDLSEAFSQLMNAGLINLKQDNIIRNFNNYTLKQSQKYDVKKYLESLHKVYNSQEKLFVGSGKKREVVRFKSPIAKEAFNLSCSFPNLTLEELDEVKEMLDDLFKSFTHLGAFSDANSDLSVTYFMATSIVEM